MNKIQDQPFTHLHMKSGEDHVKNEVDLMISRISKKSRIKWRKIRYTYLVRIHFVITWKRIHTEPLHYHQKKCLILKNISVYENIWPVSDLDDLSTPFLALRWARNVSTWSRQLNITSVKKLQKKVLLVPNFADQIWKQLMPGSRDWYETKRTEYN